MENKNKKLNAESVKTETESNEPKLPTFEHLHSKPVHRRDFLATGLIPFSASLMMPSWLNIFAKSGVAEAEDIICKATGGSTLCPYIGLKLSGGAGLAANFVPTDKGGLMLPSYSKMGMGKPTNFTILNNDFANNAPFWTTGQTTSGILTGIRTGAMPATLSKTVFAGVCIGSQDDSSTNKFDPSGMIGKAGLAGSILPSTGKVNTESGFNALAAIEKPKSPLIINRYEDVVAALGVTGTLANFSQGQKEKLFGVVKRMTASQASSIGNLSGGKTLSKLAQCATIGNEGLVKSSGNLNTSPLSNTAFAQVWGITAATSTASQDFVFATMVYNAVNGNSGTCNLDIGGYDYHDGTSTSGRTKDTQAGVVIGKILQSFAVLGKRGFLAVFSDGAVSSADSDMPDSPWMSDRGTAGIMYMMAYDPTLPPRSKGFQVGNFTDGQVADSTSLVGGSTEKAAAAIAANYLAFNDQLGLFESVAPRVFTTEELELVRIFG